jgi:hypothetical protein
LTLDSSTNRLKAKVWEKIHCANNYQQETGVTVLIADKMQSEEGMATLILEKKDFRTNFIITDKKWHLVIIRMEIIGHSPQQKQSTYFSIVHGEGRIF